MKKKVAIVGASGYSGEELVRLLLAHPHAELTAITSRRYAGQTVAQLWPRFAHHPLAKTARFSEPNAQLLAKQAEIVFLALPHGVADTYDYGYGRYAGVRSSEYRFGRALEKRFGITVFGPQGY